MSYFKLYEDASQFLNNVMVFIGNFQVAVFDENQWQNHHIVGLFGQNFDVLNPILFRKH